MGSTARLPTSAELADWGKFAEYLDSQPQEMRENLYVDDPTHEATYSVDDVLDRIDIFSDDKPSAYFKTQDFERAFEDAGIALRATQIRARAFGVSSSAYTGVGTGSATAAAFTEKTPGAAGSLAGPTATSASSAHTYKKVGTITDLGQFKEFTGSMETDEERKAFLDELSSAANVGAPAPDTLTPQQALRVQQLSLLTDVMKTIGAEFGTTIQEGEHKGEVDHQSQTWAMYFASAFFSSDDTLKSQQAKFAEIADKLIPEAMQKIAADPNLTVEQLFPKLVPMLASLGTDNPVIASGAYFRGYVCDMNFADISSEAELNALRAQVMLFERGLGNYEAVRQTALTALKPEFDTATKKIPTDRKAEIQAEAETAKREEAQSYHADWTARGMSADDIEKYTQFLIQTDVDRRMVDEAVGKHFSASSLPASKRAVWDQFNDCFDPTGEWTNVSDENWDFIEKELCINAPLIIASGGFASLARAGATSLGRSTLFFLANSPRFAGLVEAGSEVAGRVLLNGRTLTLAGRTFQIGEVTAGSLAATAAGTGVEGFAFEMANQGLHGQWLFSSPDWAQQVLLSSVTLGMFHGAGAAGEKLLAKEGEKILADGTKQVIAAGPLRAISDKITNKTVQKLFEELVIKGHLEVATMLLIGAVQNGVYAGSLKEFFDNFPEELFHAYVSILSMKAAGKVSEPMIKPLNDRVGKWLEKKEAAQKAAAEAKKPQPPQVTVRDPAAHRAESASDPKNTWREYDPEKGVIEYTHNEATGVIDVRELGHAAEVQGAPVEASETVKADETAKAKEEPPRAADERPALEDKNRIVTAAKADPRYENTRKATTKAAEAVANAKWYTSRAKMRESVMEEVRASGVEISSDTVKAVDSMIDVSLSLKRHGIMGEGEGQLSTEQIGDVLSILYLKGNPDVRIDATELTHVPMVVEGVLNFLESITGGKATASKKKVAALTALIHDSVKATLDLRTETGYTITQHKYFNNTGYDIVVKPHQTFREAIAEMQAEHPDFDAEKLTTPEYLIGVIVHHDGSNVKAFAQELAHMGIITDAEATMMWEAVQKHGLVSTWILDNSLAGIGIRSGVFTDPKYERFIKLYRKNSELLNSELSIEQIEANPAQAAELAELRAEFNKLFTPLEQAMLLGDHQGQIDPAKYITILTGVAVNKANPDLTAYELIFGGGKGANKMTDSIVGVILKAMREQQTLAPELAANSSVAFKKALAWMMMPEGRGGLTDTLLANPKTKTAFEAWQALDGNSAKTPLDWLKTVKVNPANGDARAGEFADVKAAIDSGFYDFYAPQTAGAEHGFGFSSEEVKAGRAQEQAKALTDATGAKRFAANMTQQSVTFNEHGYIPEAVDALYDRMAATGGNEHTASPGPNGTFQIKEGTEHEAPTDLAEIELEISDLDGTNTRTVLAKAMAEAHIHNGAPMPSIADLTYLSGLARLQQGLPAVHTVFGLVRGERAFVRITATYDGTRVNYEVVSSDNMANVDMTLLARRAGAIDGLLANMTPEQIEAEALGKVAQDIAADLTDWADVADMSNQAAIKKFDDRNLEDKERRDIQTQWTTLINDHVWNTSDYAPIVEAFQTHIENTDYLTKTKPKEILRDLKNLISTTKYLEELGLTLAEIKPIVENNFGDFRSYQTLLTSLGKAGITRTDLVALMKSSQYSEVLRLHENFSKDSSAPYAAKVKAIYDQILKSTARVPGTNAFAPRLYVETCRLLQECERKILGNLPSSALQIAFITQAEPFIVSQSLTEANKRSNLNGIISTPSFSVPLEKAFVTNRLNNISTALTHIASRSPGAEFLAKAFANLRDPLNYDIAKDLYTVSTAVKGEPLLRALANNQWGTLGIGPGNDFQTFISEAALAIRNNGNRAPQFLQNCIENIGASDHPNTQGYLYELQLYNAMNSLGITPTSRNFSPADVPTGKVANVETRNDGQKIVKIPFSTSTGPKMQELDMDLVLNDGPPVDYTEVKSTISQDAKQASQRAKIKAASDMGLTAIPGCFTQAVNPVLARELISNGTFRYIVQIKYDVAKRVFVVGNIYGTPPKFGGTALTVGQTFSPASLGGAVSIPLKPF